MFCDNVSPSTKAAVVKSWERSSAKLMQLETEMAQLDLRKRDRSSDAVSFLGESLILSRRCSRIQVTLALRNHQMACRSWGPTELFRGRHPRRSWKTRMPPEGVGSRRSPETLWPMPMRRSKSHRRRPRAGISTLFTAFALPIPADIVPIEGRSSEYPEEWN